MLNQIMAALGIPHVESASKGLGISRDLRRMHEAKELNQEAFAHEAGIRRTYISDIERGVRNPTITIVEKLAVTLGVPASAIFE